MSEHPTEHELKCWPEYFAAVKSGAKRHEVRVNDRDYRVGDVLLLREYRPSSDTYTGAEVRARVTYTTDAFLPDGPPKLIAMSIELEHASSLAPVAPDQRAALALFAPGSHDGLWGRIKAFIVEGAPTRTEGIAIARQITEWQCVVDDALHATAARDRVAPPSGFIAAEAQNWRDCHDANEADLPESQRMWPSVAPPSVPSHLLGEDEPCATCVSRLANCECPAAPPSGAQNE